MTLPNFFVIGANKAGTTALYHALRQHPDIYMSPVKEPTFFALEGEEQLPLLPQASLFPMVSTFDQYRALFEGVHGQRAVGEASTGYLPSPSVPFRIKQRIPAARIIAVLRDPAERAFSNYLFFRMIGLERASTFEEALNPRPGGRGSEYAQRYIGLGYYHDAIHRYLRVFGGSQVRVYLYDDWQARPLTVLSDLFRFIGVDDRFVPDLSRRHNESAVPRSPLVAAAATHVERVIPLVPPPLQAPLRSGLRYAVRALGQRRPRLAPGDRRALVALYREDILRLQDLLGRDLSPWLAPGSGATTVSSPDDGRG